MKATCSKIVNIYKASLLKSSGRSLPKRKRPSGHLAGRAFALYLLDSYWIRQSPVSGRASCLYGSRKWAMNNTSIATTVRVEPAFVDQAAVAEDVEFMGNS
jgi:hypothetical protein